MAERSADWLQQAQRDLEHGRHALAGGFYEWACFSAQQAAEKAVKAVFERMGAEAWGHSVAGLLGELVGRCPVPARLREAAKELDQAYIPTRYPNAHESGAPASQYTRTQARRLLGQAQRILEHCQSLLPQIHPG